MNRYAGKFIVDTGDTIMRVGIAICLLHGKWNRIGRLPGDTRIEKENIRFYFPVTSQIFSAFSQPLLCVLSENCFDSHLPLRRVD